MTGPNPAVRPGTEDDHEAAAEALALAFADDPAWTHLLPDSDSATRAERLLTYFAADIGNLIPRYRRLWVTEDGSGAAVWGPPGSWRVPFLRTLRPARQMTTVFGRRLPVAVWTQLRFERLHPRNPRHWYLQYLGVEPRRQGRGLGGTLLDPVLQICDREGIGAHLESSSERNRSLYQRKGFAFSEAFDLPGGGPEIHEMWREPK
jgi:GNAT superfamily N-acetyltransferase